MINFKDVTLKYGNIIALNAIDIELPEHAICGVIGRNGAGKTSLLSLISGYQRPTSGTVKVFDEDPYENSILLPQIAFITNDNSEAKSGYKVKDLLNMASVLRPKWDANYASKLIKLFNIPTNKLIGSLSHGMQSAVDIIIGLAGQTPVTIYDEAYLGMDAAMRKLFIGELLADYMERPKLILFSTHFVNEMEGLFSEVIIIHQGRILAHEESDTFRTKGVAITGSGELVDNFSVGRKVLSQRTLGKQKEVVLFGELSKADQKIAMDNDIELSRPSLQDLFIYMTDEGGEKIDSKSNEICTKETS